jgi:hypothetical protein
MSALPSPDPGKGDRVVGSAVMMLGAQRAILVPFHFLVFGVNLRKGSYLAAQAQGPFPSILILAAPDWGPARSVLRFHNRQPITFNPKMTIFVTIIVRGN